MVQCTSLTEAQAHTRELQATAEHRRQSIRAPQQAPAALPHRMQRQQYARSMHARHISLYSQLQNCCQADSISQTSRQHLQARQTASHRQHLTLMQCLFTVVFLALSELQSSCTKPCRPCGLRCSRLMKPSANTSKGCASPARLRLVCH
jgi:hypothetical protein